MSGQIRLLDETLVTQLTLERLLSRVDPEMIFEVELLSKQFTAFGANLNSLLGQRLEEGWVHLYEKGDRLHNQMVPKTSLVFTDLDCSLISIFIF